MDGCPVEAEAARSAVHFLAPIRIPANKALTEMVKRCVVILLQLLSVFRKFDFSSLLEGIVQQGLIYL